MAPSPLSLPLLPAASISPPPPHLPPTPHTSYARSPPRCRPRCRPHLGFLEPWPAPQPHSRDGAGMATVRLPPLPQAAGSWCPLEAASPVMGPDVTVNQLRVADYPRWCKDPVRVTAALLTAGLPCGRCRRLSRSPLALAVDPRHLGPSPILLGPPR